MNPQPVTPLRRAATPSTAGIRTFHPRRSRVSARQARALVEQSQHWAVPVQAGPVDLTAVFGAQVPVLEVGFGMGEATWRMAADDPDTGVLAVDVHTPGVGALLAAIAAEGLTNVRVVHGDAVDVLRDMVEPGALAGVRVFFPDPWPKQRHHKRRFVRPDVVDLVVSRLRPGGFLHCATDWPDYAEQMVRVLDAHPQLRDDDQVTRRCVAARPRTRFEERGRALGHPVADVVRTRTLRA
jgi:tRNA (guanine-N7-)-methyltransferase